MSENTMYLIIVKNIGKMFTFVLKKKCNWIRCKCVSDCASMCLRKPTTITRKCSNYVFSLCETNIWKRKRKVISFYWTSISSDVGYGLYRWRHTTRLGWRFLLTKRMLSSLHTSVRGVAKTLPEKCFPRLCMDTGYIAEKAVFRRADVRHEQRPTLSEQHRTAQIPKEVKKLCNCTNWCWTRTMPDKG